MCSSDLALDDVNHCPRCGATPDVDHPRSIRCSSCGYVAFYNPKPVAATIPFTEDGEIVLLRRAIEPSRGLWTFPGGFVDLGESIEDAARRETREEVHLDVDLTGLVGVYSRADERVVLVVYSARAHAQPEVGDETAEVGTFTPDDLPWDELAFWSTEHALRDALRDPRPIPGSTPG